jgi:hypothetical protein
MTDRPRKTAVPWADGSRRSEQPPGIRVSEAAGRYRSSSTANATMKDATMTFDSAITIDSLIRKNRDLIEVDLATADERASVIDVFVPTGFLCGQLNDWHAVAIRDVVLKSTSIHLLGKHVIEGRLITSEVLAISPDRRVARTADSIYMLGVEADGDPPLDMLPTIADALVRWGFNRIYGLDVMTDDEFARLW